MVMLFITFDEHYLKDATKNDYINRILYNILYQVIDDLYSIN